MHDKFRILELKKIFVFILLFCSILKGFAHSPDWSSLMIYEQNGRHFLAIKSSLTAFEGEIDYSFTKNAYKTPEEFKQLVSTYFQKKCLLIINNDTIKFSKPSVILGHETTIFVELTNLSQKIKTLYLKNELFADMPYNQCEIILAIKGYPQKQFILKKENLHEVRLFTENGRWTVEDKIVSFFKSSDLLVGILIFISALVIASIVIWRKKISKNRFC